MLRGTPEDADLIVIKTHLSGALASNALHTIASRRCRIGRRPQLRDEPQDVGEEIFRDSTLGHLEGDVAAMAHDLRADLDQFLLQTGQRPLLDRLWRRQRAKEISKIVSQRMKLETHRVGGKRPA